MELELLKLLYKGGSIMKRWFKKLVCLALSAVFASFAFFGCSSTSDKEEEAFSSEIKDIYENLQPVTLTFLFPGSEPSGWKIVRTQLEIKLKSTVNVKLDFKWLPQDSYFNNIRSITASAESFDAFTCGEPDRNSIDFVQMARSGELRDITELFPVNAPTLSLKYIQEELDYAKVDGRLYAVPSLSPYGLAEQVYVKDDYKGIAEKIKIKNYDDYEKFLEEIKNTGRPGQAGAVYNISGSMVLFARMYDYVILDRSLNLLYKWGDPHMMIIPWEKTPEFKEAMFRLQSWYEKKYMQTFPILDPASSLYYFDFIPVDDIGIANLYQLYPDKPVQRANSMGRLGVNSSMAFCANSKNVERALMFLDWIQKSRENHFLFMYGIEGEHYVIKDGRPDYPEGMDHTNSTYMNWSGSSAFKNPEYQTYTRDSGEKSANYRDAILKITRIPTHAGFYPDYSKVINIADRRANLIKSYDYLLLERKPEDSKVIDPDEYIKMLDEAGTLNLVMEIQAQLDKWRDSKN